MLAPIVAILATTSGCAIGVTHDYGSASPMIHAGSGPFAVAVNDQREYVVSGESDPSYVGVQRAGYGNPYDVNTVSGKALKEEFATTIQKALGHSNTQTVLLRQGAREDVALAALSETGASRLVLLTLHEWQTDTYNNTSLYYDVSLEIFDGDEREIASERFEGEEDLGGSFINPPSHARSAVPPAYEEKLETFFTTPSVRSALAGSGSAPATSGGSKSRGATSSGSSRAATTRLEELEKLRDAGLVSEQEYQRKRSQILDEL